MIYTGAMPGEVFRVRKSMINWETQGIIGAGLKTRARKKNPIVVCDIMIPVLEILCDRVEGRHALAAKQGCVLRAVLRHAGRVRLPQAHAVLLPAYYRHRLWRSTRSRTRSPRRSCATAATRRPGNSTRTSRPPRRSKRRTRRLACRILLPTRCVHWIRFARKIRLLRRLKVSPAKGVVLDKGSPGSNPGFSAIPQVPCFERGTCFSPGFSAITPESLDFRGYIFSRPRISLVSSLHCPKIIENRPPITDIAALARDENRGRLSFDWGTFGALRTSPLWMR